MYVCSMNVCMYCMHTVKATNHQKYVSLTLIKTSIKNKHSQHKSTVKDRIVFVYMFYIKEWYLI